MSVHPKPLPAPLYQGSVNTWECDDGGHLNVRFHLERAMVGLAHLAHHLDMPAAFSGTSSATVLPTEIHVRFHKEARPAACLDMHGAVVSLGQSDGAFCLDMRHDDGAPSSAFTVRAAHVEARDLKPFAWSKRSRAAAKAITRALPDHAKPRALDLTRPPAADASLARADELGLTRIGAAAVTPDQCDAFGRMRPDHLFGRVSDSAPNLMLNWRREAAKAGAVAPAGAVVEARMVLRRWPRAGDLITIRSGVAELSGKTLRLVHWLCDPVSGAAWASLEVIALTFDIATRKAIAPSEAATALMQKRIVPGLTV